MQRSALCRSRRELSIEYLLAKFGFDTAENKPEKVRKFVLSGIWICTLKFRDTVQQHLVTWGICTRRAGKLYRAVSTPIFASKYALESSRRDLHNALLCTVLNAQNFRQKSLKILLIFSPNFAKFDKFCLDFAQILPDFCRIFQIRSRRNVQGTGRLPRRLPGRLPGRVPGGSPQFAFSRKTPHTAPPKKLASSCARPAAALRDLARWRLALKRRWRRSARRMPRCSASAQLKLNQKLKKPILKIKSIRSWKLNDSAAKIKWFCS